MDLTMLADLAEIFGGVAVIIALVFGIAQIRQFRQQRLDAADLELMRMLQDAEFIQSFKLIYPLPSSISAQDLRAMGPEYESAALAMSARFEALGLLVFRGSIPFELVEQINGGNSILFWRKLQRWIEQMRTEQGHALLFEWFQWLAERMAERDRLKQIPAYHRHREWNSPR
jgi:hypothetical protein